MSVRFFLCNEMEQKEYREQYFNKNLSVFDTIFYRKLLKLTNLLLKTNYTQQVKDISAEFCYPNKWNEEFC